MSACYRFHQLDYDSCTVKELRGFLAAKTQDEIPRRYFFFDLRKQDLISRLRAYDDEAAFRFSGTRYDLPPELRLHVCEHLAFHPQVLYTCRKYRDEAKKTIDEAATRIKLTGIEPPRENAPAMAPPTGLAALFLTITDDEHWEQNAIPELTIGTDVLKLPSTDGSLSQMSKQLGSIRSHVYSASQVLLDCSITRFSASAVNRALYLLATILNSAHRVETRVDITLENTIISEDDYQVVVQALYPLTKIRSGVFLTIGRCPPELRRRVETMLAQSGSGTNILFDAMQLENKIRAEIKVSQKLGMPVMSRYSVLHWLRAMNLGPLSPQWLFDAESEQRNKSRLLDQEEFYLRMTIKALKEERVRRLAERAGEVQDN